MHSPQNKYCGHQEGSAHLDISTIHAAVVEFVPEALPFEGSIAPELKTHDLVSPGFSIGKTKTGMGIGGMGISYQVNPWRESADGIF
jgi:hypothetical protein